MRRIFLPLCTPGFISAGIFAFTLSQNEFLYALIFLTKSSVRTVPVGVIAELIRGDVFYWGQLMAATIFVNPKQFAPNEDLDAYPRREEADLAMLRSAGIALVFMPGTAEIYPPGFATTVRVAGLTDCLCGAHRPGHFDGVSTVVTKLLIQSLPDVAYFGEKDYQQLVVVRRLARDLDISVRIAGVPTVRDTDGLALSSRNAYLSPAERRIAPNLARVLRRIAAALAAQPGTVASEIAPGRADLESAGLAVEYLEIREADTLAPVTETVTGPARIFAAVHLGRTRLIDNLPITREA
jgi:pantoate--beta-alanine ligase